MFFIPDLFTPYIQGREQAINRNWSDLQKYNTTQAGQLTNLYNLATFSPRVNKEWEATQAAALNNQFNEDTYYPRLYASNLQAANGLLGLGQGLATYGANTQFPYLRNQQLATQTQSLINNMENNIAYQNWLRQMTPNLFGMQQPQTASQQQPSSTGSLSPQTGQPHTGQGMSNPIFKNGGQNNQQIPTVPR